MERSRIAVGTTLGALAASVAAVTVSITYGLLREYGTTTGSWTEGAVDGLQLGVAGVGVTVLLVALAVRLGPRRRWLLRSGVALSVLTLVGVVAGGALAAVAKHDSLPAAPTCSGDGFGAPIRQLLAEARGALRQLDHPGRFSGGGSTGYDGCSDSLLDTTAEEAVAAYHRQLTQRGWRITDETAGSLRARRGDLVFRLHRGEGQVVVTVRPTRTRAAEVLRELE